MHTVTLPAKQSIISKSQRKMASCGFERIATCVAAARESLSSAIRQQLHNSFTRTYRWASDGTAFVLYYSDAWQYDIIGDGAREQGIPCTVTPNASEQEYHLALTSMESHVAGYCD